MLTVPPWKRTTEVVVVFANICCVPDLMGCVFVTRVQLGFSAKPKLRISGSYVLHSIPICSICSSFEITLLLPLFNLCIKFLSKEKVPSGVNQRLSGRYEILRFSYSRLILKFPQLFTQENTYKKDNI